MRLKLVEKDAIRTEIIVFVKHMTFAVPTIGLVHIGIYATGLWGIKEVCASFIALSSASAHEAVQSYRHARFKEGKAVVIPDLSNYRGD